jgi:hypothetical protein
VNLTARRIGYIFLCALPFLFLAVGSARALRIPGVYQSIGGVLFAVTLVAAWVLGARMIGFGASEQRRVALPGALLVVPFAVMSLLWVGIGAPFQATLAENHMRFLVLLANSIVVAGAFILLKEALGDAGERFYSTLGFAASIPAGAAYLFCISMSVASSVAGLPHTEASTAGLLGELYSILEFVACTMTYIATAAFAASLGQARWLGRGAARAYVTASLVCLLLLVMRGVSFPELSADTAPWYVRPGFIAGVPAVPWIMPCLLGVVLLRRAGDKQL